VKAFNFITQNSGKVAELQAKANEFGLEIVQINASYPEIQADTLEEIVWHGLSYCREKFPAPFIIEDSGLFIDEVHGFPGPYSAYVHKTIGNSGVLKLIGAGRPARFESVIGSYYRDFKLFQGRVEGHLVRSRGLQGFGFDPIFEYEGRTFAEMTVSEKNAVSHRSKAVERFLEWASTVI
jgi:XTP/dITP diphosphohydrolase